jgi:hypothetical protein
MLRICKRRWLAALTLLLSALPSFAGELKAPVRLEAEGKPIDTPEPGHAAPFIGDFDGDGKLDLLVGQFAGGLLRIYKNTGTNAQPKYASGAEFRADNKTASVPTG